MRLEIYKQGSSTVFHPLEREEKTTIDNLEQSMEKKKGIK